MNYFVPVLIGIAIFGILHNLRMKRKMKIKGKIPPERMSKNFTVILAFAIALIIIRKVSGHFWDVLILFAFGYAYYLTGLLSEGINEKGIRTFSSFTLLSKFVYWSGIEKIYIDVEERYIKLDIMGTKFAGFQYYSTEDLDEMTKLFKKNKKEFTVFR